MGEVIFFALVLVSVLRLPSDHVVELNAIIVCKGMGICLTHVVVFGCD